MLHVHFINNSLNQICESSSQGLGCNPYKPAGELDHIVVYYFNTFSKYSIIIILLLYYKNETSLASTNYLYSVWNDLIQKYDTICHVFF